ncbi:trophoblast glycoprotein [Arctopsyche grandis]|uniref:trophoblast glycoprotein n=1 Tax=Arctopsyche grandis TaxID=121162 RepID=UPI00406D6A12
MRKKLIFVLTVVQIFVHALGKGCGPKFGDKCNCGRIEYDYRDQFVVNCTNQNFNNTDILAELPDETQVLIFTGNYIPEVPWNIFGTLNDLENLRVVDMSNNSIKEIKGKSYHHVQNVERLILNHNDLVISSDYESDVNHHHPRVLSNFVNLLELHLTNAFQDNTDAALANDLHDIFVNSNLTRLMKLHLEQNEIRSFRDHKVFCDLPNLHDLHLGNNLLTDINFNLTCMKHLRFLDLEGNLIETLTKHELNLLEKVNAIPGRDVKFVVDFRTNPFSCDCGIFDFVSWIKHTNVTVRNVESLRCTRPKLSAGGPLLKLKVSPCKNLAPKKTSNKREKAAVGLLIFTTMFVLSLIVIVIYMSRYKLRTKITPLIEAISKKVQYTTIKNRDNVEDI